MEKKDVHLYFYIFLSETDSPLLILVVVAVGGAGGIAASEWQKGVECGG